MISLPVLSTTWMMVVAAATISSSFLLVGAQTTTTTTTCPDVTLGFREEFDGSALDTSIWTPQIGNGCEQGTNLCGWGNNEAQYYRSENVQVSDGTLKIIAQKEDFQGFGFTSGRIRSLNQIEIDLTKPTYIEAKIQIPNGGQGMWPAFWMLPTPVVVWPMGGEIDIMEFIGREPFFGHGYMHYGAAFGDKGAQGGPMRFPEPIYERFHTFGLLKTTDRMAYFMDGFEYQVYTPSDIEPKYSWPFENSFHFLLNLAVGGYWPGYPDETSIFPTTLEVDYVRVYNISDDDAAMTAFPTITGSRLLHPNTAQEEYCVQNAPRDASIDWQVPTDATFSISSSTTSTTTACIFVDFGSESGYVQAIITSSCATDGIYELSVPIEVQPLYGVVSTVWDATIAADFAKGTLASVIQDGVPAWEYTRNSLELYDHIQIDLSSALSDPETFISGEKKFFLDIQTTTSAPCTQIMIQLEDQSQSVPDNYPVGRHSRFQCLLEPTKEWQRVACEWIDQPDKSVTNVDRVSLLIDPTLARDDVYYIGTVDISAAGCTTDCESLQSNGASTSNCRRAGKSEAGACQDGGFNNDWEGYNGNLVSDCDDPACYMIDPVCGGPPESTPTFSTTSPASPSATPFQPGTTPSATNETVPLPLFSGSAECSLNEACVGLTGNCCPNAGGIFLCKPLDDCAVATLRKSQQSHNRSILGFFVFGVLFFCPGCCFESIPLSGYTKDFTLIGPQDGVDQAKYVGSTSPYVVPVTAPDDSFPVVTYTRNLFDEFDLIYYTTSAIANAREYVEGTRKFYMDVYRPSLGNSSSSEDRCTRILLQLDATDMTSTEEFPSGRHSRYIAFVTTSDAWERVEFVFLDQPDSSVDDAGVAALVLFFNPGAIGNDETFFFRNLDSAKSGCKAFDSSSGCEAVIPKSCPAFFPGESGGDDICSDGEDNDLDGLVDCIDTDCMLEPICGTTISQSYVSATYLMQEDGESGGVPKKSSAPTATTSVGRTGKGGVVLAMIWVAGQFS